MDHNNPIISVIIPVYNQEKYLGKCILSVLSQSFLDFEVILVNDGSTDRSLNISQKYARKDSRVSIVNKPNEGVAYARKDGFLKAKGEYICFLDSDDYLAPNALEILYKLAKEKHVDLVIGSYDVVYDNWALVKKTASPFLHTDRLLSKDEFFLLLLGLGDEMGNSFGGSVIWGRLYKRSCIQFALDKNEQQLFPYRVHIGEDNMFNLTIARYLNSIWITNAIILHYRYGGVSTRNCPQIKNSALYFDQRFDYCVQYGLDSFHQKLLVYYSDCLLLDIVKLIHFHPNSECEIKQYLQEELSQRKVVIWAKQNNLDLQKYKNRIILLQAIIDSDVSTIMNLAYEQDALLQRIHYPKMKCLRLYQKIVDKIGMYC